MMRWTRVSTLKVREEFRAHRRPLALEPLLMDARWRGEQTLRRRALLKQWLRARYARAHLRV